MRHWSLLQAFRQLPIAAADQDELRVAKTLGDFQHDFRSLSAEQHQPGGTSGVEAQPRALRGAVDGDGLIDRGRRMMPEVAKMRSFGYASARACSTAFPVPQIRNWFCPRSIQKCGG